MKIDYKELVQAGLHFGHQRYRWSPKMEAYIWGHRNGIHLIDISKTAQALEKAASFLKDIAANGEQILWVGTKKVASKKISEVANDISMPYVDYRWVGGMLTNYTQVKKSVTRMLHFEDVLKRADEFGYTKKELNHYQKVTDRLSKSVGGIRKLQWPVGAVVVIDAKKEMTAVREAAQCGIPVIALVDTNSDPSFVDYVIPGNDDSTKSIGLVLDFLLAGVKAGKEVAAKEKEKAAAAEEARKAAKKDATADADKKVAKKEAAPVKKAAAPKKVVEPKKVAEKKAVVKKVAPAKTAAPAKAAVVAKEDKKPAEKKVADKAETKKV